MDLKIKDMSAKHIGQYVTVEGTVDKTGTQYPFLSLKAFRALTKSVHPPGTAIIFRGESTRFATLNVKIVIARMNKKEIKILEYLEDIWLYLILKQ